MLLTNGEDLQTTVLRAPIGICILNADSLVAEIVNNKFLEVAGKPYEAIFGQFYWDAFAEARQYYEEALAGVVETGEDYYADEAELMLIRHGREEKVFVTFVYAPIQNAGKISKVAVWVLENTKQVNERQKVEVSRQAFQIERDRLKRFFMQASAGICILHGPELVFELVNPAYQQLLPGRKLLDRPIFEALPELVGGPLQDVLLNVYRTGEPYEINELLIPVAKHEGGPTHDRYFSFSYQPRRGENDKVDGILVFVFEVTGMMNVQKELREAREESDQQKRIYETVTSCMFLAWIIASFMRTALCYPCGVRRGKIQLVRACWKMVMNHGMPNCTNGRSTRLRRPNNLFVVKCRFHMPLWATGFTIIF